MTTTIVTAELERLRAEVTEVHRLRKEVQGERREIRRQRGEINCQRREIKRLGLIYRDGLCGVEVDHKQALYWLEKANLLDPIGVLTAAQDYEDYSQDALLVGDDHTG